MRKLAKLEFLVSEGLDNPHSRIGRRVDRMLIGMIAFATLVFVLETTNLVQEFSALFFWTNAGLLIFFAIEYALRFLIQRRHIKFLFSFFSIVDLAVIASFLVLFLPFPGILFFRLARVFLILKAIRHSDLLRSFLRSFKNYHQELKIFFASFCLILVMSASLMYFLEHGINKHFDSIPHALWWAAVTIFTVGYGDMVPVTVFGRIIAALVMFFGLMTLAIMTGLVTKVFMDNFFGKRQHLCKICQYPHHDHDAKFCKNCGAQLDIRALSENAISYDSD